MTTTDAAAIASPDGAVGAPQLPTFRRATPNDAIDVAQAAFVLGERVDMGTVATQLAISRATLYRWFASRDELLEQMLVKLAEEFCSAALVGLDQEGDARVLEYARRLMNATLQFEPLGTFVTREPQLALRLLIGQRGAIHEAISRAMLAVVAESRAPADVVALQPNIDIVVWVGTSLQWATLAAGEEPQTERAVDVLRALLVARPAPPA
jgi:AcrR family transcriptional regulator